MTKQVKPIKKMQDTRMGYEIKIEWFKQHTFQMGGYDEWCVVANGFIIAHFVDETSMQSYLHYLVTYGFKLYPKKIMEIIEAEAKKGTIQSHS